MSVVVEAFRLLSALVSLSGYIVLDWVARVSKRGADACLASTQAKLDAARGRGMFGDRAL